MKSYTEQLTECNMLIQKYKLEFKELSEKEVKEPKDYSRLKYLDGEIDEQTGSLQIKKRRLMNLIN